MWYWAGTGTACMDGGCCPHGFVGVLVVCFLRVPVLCGLVVCVIWRVGVNVCVLGAVAPCGLVVLVGWWCVGGVLPGGHCPIVGWWLGCYWMHIIMKVRNFHLGVIMCVYYVWVGGWGAREL